jgi:hypothetical protein
VNGAQKALLARLREIIDETPNSGALTAGGRPLQVSAFARAVEARADDGPALVDYARGKVHQAAMASYSALIKAGRPDLTVEGVVADADAEWATEFTDEDRTAARARLGDMLETHRKAREDVEATAVAHDRKIVDQVSANRVAKGKPPLTPEQDANMLKERSARRAAGN